MKLRFQSVLHIRKQKGHLPNILFRMRFILYLINVNVVQVNNPLFLPLQCASWGRPTRRRRATTGQMVGVMGSWMWRMIRVPVIMNIVASWTWCLVLFIKPEVVVIQWSWCRRSWTPRWFSCKDHHGVQVKFCMYQKLYLSVCL